MLTDKVLSKTLSGTLLTDSNPRKEPTQGFWLEDKTDLRLPWNFVAATAPLMGKRFPHQNETKPKPAEYSQAQIHSRVPWRELGYWMQPPGFGPASCHFLALGLWGHGLASLGISFSMSDRKKAFVFDPVKPIPTVPNFLWRTNTTRDQIFTRVNKRSQTLEGRDEIWKRGMA